MSWTRGDTAIALLALAGIWLIWTFNRLIRLRNQVRAGWSDIDVQLQRRHDLVPALVEAVRGYASHEKTLLEAVAAMRQQAAGATAGPAQRSGLETRLGQQITQVLALREAYPDLKANQNFMQLQAQLVTVEDTLQYARRFYNGAVRELNNSLQEFPAVLVAGSFGFKPAEFFQAEDRSAPQVKFS